MAIRTGSILLILSLVFMLGTLQAKGPEISLVVQKRIVKLGEPVMVQVEVSGSERVTEVKAPQSKSFEINRLGTSSNISIVNGVVSNSQSYNYQIYPSVKGKLTIPSFTVVTNAGTYKTKQTEIKVVASARTVQNANPQTKEAGEKIFFRITPSREEVHPNEPVVLNYYIYSKVPFNNPELVKEPDFSRVITENFEPSKTQNQRRVKIQGTEYVEIYLGRRIIYPLEQGKLKMGISQIQVGLVVRKKSPFSSFDDLFRDDPFFGSSRDFFSPFTNVTPRRLFSNDLVLDVKPFPEGAPQSFSGLVGQFRINAELDKAEIEAGEAVNLSVEITGNGNLKGFELPIEPGAEFKTYDSKHNLDHEIIDGVLYSRLTYDVVLVPQKSGGLSVPGFRFSYYDPEKKAYTDAKTSPLYLKVTGQFDESDLISSAPVTGQVQQQEVRVLEQDIQYIKQKSRLNDHVPAFRNTAFKIIILIALFSPFICMGGKRIFSMYYGNETWKTRHKSQAKALASLESLSQRIGTTAEKEAYAEFSEILSAFLRERLGIPNWAGSEELCRLLSEAGLSNETITETAEIYEAIYQSAYAPVSAGRDEIKKLIKRIKTVLRMICNEK